jgi:hypothetical protein
MMTPTSVGRGRLFQTLFVRPGLKSWQKPSGLAGMEIKILSTRLLHYTRERHSFLLGGAWKSRTTLMSGGRGRMEDDQMGGGRGTEWKRRQLMGTGYYNAKGGRTAICLWFEVAEAALYRTAECRSHIRRISTITQGRNCRKEHRYPSLDHICVSQCIRPRNFGTLTTLSR